MPSSDTVKIVVKLKDEYFLEEDNHKENANSVIVHKSMYNPPNVKIIRKLYPPVQEANNKGKFSGLFKFLSELPVESGKKLVLESLFSSIENELVCNLMNAAFEKKRYKGSNLMNFFFIETSEGNEKAILAKINNNEIEGIEYAYIKGKLADMSLVSANSTNSSGISEEKEESAKKKQINGVIIEEIRDIIKGIGEIESEKSEVTIFDVEQGWDFSDVGISDLKSLSTDILGGGFNGSDFVHGTKTLNVLFGKGGKSDEVLNGLCLNAKPRIASVWFKDSKQRRIEAALMTLFGMGRDANGNLVKDKETIVKEGDIVLLELQTTISVEGLFPLEIEPALFDIIKLAVEVGFIIIEAAGNGGINLNNQIICNSESKCNYKHLRNKASGTGAIMVGAKEKEDSEGPALKSNFGNRIDYFSFGDTIPVSTRLTFRATSLASAITAAMVANFQIKNSGKSNINDVKDFLNKKPI